MQTLLEQEPVWKSGQCIMKRSLLHQGRGMQQVNATLGIGDVRSSDIGQRLSCGHRHFAQGSRCFPVQIESAQLAGTLVQRKREHRSQTGLQCPRYEERKPHLLFEVRNRDRFTGRVGLQARSLAELRLQPLETEG